MKRAFVLVALVVLLIPVVLLAKDSDSRDSLVRFEGGIGVDPVSSGVVTPATAATATTATDVNRNFVRGTPPPGQIWRIAALTADVKVDGRIRVHGRGLLLAGGNNIGTNANQSVRARLFCGNSSFDSVNLVALQANGDFRIDDVLRPTPLPNPCTTPVLLIINSGGSWFAAGIPDLDD